MPDQAFEIAGLVSSDVRVAEVHEFITRVEPIGYEGQALAERFGGRDLVERPSGRD